jgi:hypothetical protein
MRRAMRLLLAIGVPASACEYSPCTCSWERIVCADGCTDHREVYEPGIGAGHQGNAGGLGGAIGDGYLRRS